jgi:hypothetical protein
MQVQIWLWVAAQVCDHVIVRQYRTTDSTIRLMSDVTIMMDSFLICRLLQVHACVTGNAALAVADAYAQSAAVKVMLAAHQMLQHVGYEQ